MSDETALSTGASIGGVQLPASKYASAEEFNSVITAASFLPRLQLFGANSGPAKEGKIQMGRYGIVRSKDSIIDVGASVNCLVLGMRLKAMEIAEEGIISKYNPKDEEFKRIAATADADGESGCMYGAEFLLYLPDQKEFVSFFMSSKSARREAPVLNGLLGKAATVGVKLVKTKKYSWHAPSVTICSAPLSPPDTDKLLEEANKFANPPESDVESTKPHEAAATSRNR